MSGDARGLRIWFVELGEPLPFQAGQRLLRYGELTRALARRGHDVTWWACDFSHQTKTFIGQPDARVESDGVHIVLAHGSGYRRHVGLKRLRHFRVHAASLERLIRAEAPPDIVVSAMPTMEACQVATTYAARHHTPIIIDIRDEWPEDYVRRLPAALRPLGRLALRGKFAGLGRICRAATALSAVTERQLDYGLHHAGRVRRSGDAVFHTGARRERLDPGVVAERTRAWRARGLTEQDFVGVFTGTMSAARPLDATIAAARRLAGTIPFKLVLAGSGDDEARYRAQAEGSANILFAGWVDTPDMAALSGIADVLLAPYSPAYGFSMPTKIFDYMAAARPLVSSCPGEAEELIRTEGIGVQVRVDDVNDIEQALLRLYQDPDGRRRMGERARAVFEERFALETIVEHYADHIEHLARIPRPA